MKLWITELSGKRGKMHLLEKQMRGARWKHIGYGGWLRWRW